MKLILELKCDKFPISYHMLGTSFIKQALFLDSEEYFNKLYNYGEEKRNKKIKNFCFSMRAFDYELNHDEFTVRDKVVMVISSPDCELIIRLYNGFLKFKEIKYKNYKAIINRIYTKQHKQLTRNNVVLKTCSPIWIKDKENNSMELNDTTYQAELNYICNEILKSYRDGLGLHEKITLVPVDMRKKVVKQLIQDFTEKTNKDIYYMNCYEGIFKLEAAIEDLNDLIALGIGFKRSQGYGLVDIV